MKRAQWLNKKSHAVETIRCADGKQLAVIIHDDAGRSSEGFGPSEEAAFGDAHEKYTASRKRAAHTVDKYHVDRFVGRVYGKLGGAK